MHKIKGMAKILIVGAGFAGCVCARTLAEAGHDIYLIEKRQHIGGNAYDSVDSIGVLVHTYGPHIFHTNSTEVVGFLSRFTQWSKYEHRVLARVDGKLYPIPINRTTLEAFFGVELPSEMEAGNLLNRLREKRLPAKNSEEAVLNSVGQKIYRSFFEGYSLKQWGVSPAELDTSVCARIPTRLNTDDRYFTDFFQAVPKDGFFRLFKRMLEHENITHECGQAYEKQMEKGFEHLIWTGAIDSFYGYSYGKLPYRGINFEHIQLPDTDTAQPAGTINEPSKDVPYTRTTEFKHLTGQRCKGTSILREYPTSGDCAEPAYPVPCEKSKRTYKLYEQKAKEDQNVTFVGRMALYRYLNMDATVSAALDACSKLLSRPALEPR